MAIIGDHPTNRHPYGDSLTAADSIVATTIQHRSLLECGRNEEFLGYTVQALQRHHIDEATLRRRQELMREQNITGANYQRVSPYPTNPNTRKGNFAEIVLAEYLLATTDAHMPIYRLRYNPNPDQAMKGDDVLLFDLDSPEPRIIVGESKFRGTPTRQAVCDIIEGLVRSNKSMIPVSLTFVSDRLFGSGNEALGQKVLNCVNLIISNRIDVHYVGFLLSNTNSSQCIETHAVCDMRNLLMLSLGMDTPENIVEQAFRQLEA